LLRYLFVATRGDELAARDALQETMTRVVRYARRFDSEEAFWSWLTVLARSAVVDGGRKRVRYWRLLTRYALSWINRPSESASSDPENDLVDLLDECLDALPKLDRQLVEAKYFGEVSLRDLAAKYGLTERAVESRLLRARRQLRADLLLKMKDETRNG
jgi:RNA polymerase sigma factor (sigma-70 family)